MGEFRWVLMKLVILYEIGVQFGFVWLTSGRYERILVGFVKFGLV